ncbi:hypothetical protein BLGI_213 [Brevibacillus laterosporus GI-9]|nr:hypothetical protein BLGI_213 [Brevibacillus laterosporus GI-9]
MLANKSGQKIIRFFKEKNPGIRQLHVLFSYKKTNKKM